MLNSELIIAQLLEAHSGRETISKQISEINERLAEAEKVQKSKNAIPTSVETRNALERQHKGLSSLNLVLEFFTKRQSVMSEDMLWRFDRIHKWLSPPEFAKDFEKALDQREPGTAEWLFDEKVFRSWYESTPLDCLNPEKRGFEKRALWVQGSQGRILPSHRANGV